MPHAISIESCTVTAGSSNILGPVSFTVGWGESVALMGPSGSGKTTLLRILRGETSPTIGDVTIAGEKVINKSRGRSPRKRRKLAAVDQDPMLMTELTVGENVALPLLLSATGSLIFPESHVSHDSSSQ